MILFLISELFFFFMQNNFTVFNSTGLVSCGAAAADQTVPHTVKMNNLFQQQSTLEEITNKVFNELLQRKVDAHSKTILQQQEQHQHQQQSQQKRLSDHEDAGIRSEDWCSESSVNNCSQLRHPIPKGRTFVTANKNRKYTIMPSVSSAAILTNDSSMTKSTTSDQNVALIVEDNNKKPLIAKWKAGVKVQNALSTSTVSQLENHGGFGF